MNEIIERSCKLALISKSFEYWINRLTIRLIKAKKRERLGGEGHDSLPDDSGVMGACCQLLSYVASLAETHLMVDQSIELIESINKLVR